MKDDVDGGRGSLTDQVYNGLIDLILSGELVPGDVLVERTIAERLRASRTPVREAFGRLEAEGLVHKQINRGVTISPFSSDALIEVLNVRKLLEGEAASLAAGRISGTEIEAIREADAAIGALAQPTLQQIWDADDLLHRAIAEASGNMLLAGLIRDLRRRTHVLNSYVFPRRRALYGGGHEEIIEALLAGDREGARRAMIAHIDAVKTSLIDRLAK